MLSDEEKKAIESLIEIREFANLSSYKDVRINQLNAIDVVLNLIEKQSKEIEELKNEVMEKELIIDGMKEDRRIAVEEIQEEYFISKDKIKSKIEEYKKEIDKLYKKKNWYEPQDTEKKNKYMHYIEFGQSLLEKE